MKEEIIDKKSAVKECEMCHEPIIDKYYLNVGDLMTVHEKCLKCASCSRLLEQKKCFYKDRKFYCADCCRSYNCHKCHRSIGQNEYFIRLNHKLLYHTDCFRCSMCLCRIDPGSPYALLDDNILCENHYYETRNDRKSQQQLQETDRSGDKTIKNSIDHQSETNNVTTDPMKNPTKARTSFTHQQLRVMKAQFLQNENPTPKELNELGEKIGIKKKVLQIWFQNSRAKQRKFSSEPSNKTKKKNTIQKKKKKKAD